MTQEPHCTTPLRPSSPWQCEVEERIINSSPSTPTPEAISSGRGSFNVSQCASTTVESSASFWLDQELNASLQDVLALPQFAGASHWATSGFVIPESDALALRRRTERLEAASSYLEGWTFNFDNLVNAPDPPDTSDSGKNMAWEIWTVGIGSQFP